MDSDWIVWPIFLVELLAFLFLFRTKRFRKWVHILLVAVCVGIVVSLSHDATTPLNLNF